MNYMGQCITKFIRSLVVLCALVFLTGCPCGNGWPYGADDGGCRNRSSSTDDTGEDSASGGSLVASPSFEWNDPDYTCVPNGSSDPIASYKSKITYTDGTWTRYGDRCSQLNGDAPVVLSESSVDLSAFGWNLVGYEDGIYSGSSDFVNVWCTEVGGSREVIVSYASGSVIPLMSVGGAWLYSQEPAVRILGTMLVRYRNNSFILDIELAASSGAPDFHAGELRQIGSSPLVMRCRLTRP